jgi:hypothetical protein
MRRAKFSFEPDTSLYGREVILLDEDGENPKNIGVVESIQSPHCATIGGREWEWDSSDDFQPQDDGTILLFSAW